MVIDWNCLNPVVTFANVLKCSGGFSFGPRMIQDHQFIFIAEGMGKATIQDRSYHAKKGDLFYYGPDITHYFIADLENPFTLYGIHFDFEQILPRKGGIRPVEITYVNNYLQSEPPNNLQLGKKGNDEFLINEYCHIGISKQSNLLLKIIKNYPLENGMTPKLNQALFTLFLFDLCEVQDEYGSDDEGDIAELLKEQLESHEEYVYERSWLREWTQYHEDHAARLFRKRFGVSPHEYHSIRKIEKAKQYLINTDLRINEISDKLNFGSVHHFSRKFKLKTGYTPTKYRLLSRLI